jgi:uncharacterized protein
MNTDTIIVFAKEPLAGRVKTRLCPPLTPDEAARLYEAFIADTLDMALAIKTCSVTLAYTPEDARGYFEVLADGRKITLTAQRGADLGDRMRAALGDAFSGGAGRAVLIGTDIPTLHSNVIREAFRRLERFDAAFAPTNDGGYCLVALNKPCDALFTGIKWSTATVLDDTLTRAKEAGLSVLLLPEQHDVDTPEELSALFNIPLPTATASVITGLRHALAAK